MPKREQCGRDIQTFNERRIGRDIAVLKGLLGVFFRYVASQDRVGRGQTVRSCPVVTYVLAELKKHIGNVPN